MTANIEFPDHPLQRPSTFNLATWKSGLPALNRWENKVYFVRTLPPDRHGNIFHLGRDEFGHETWYKSDGTWYKNTGHETLYCDLVE